MKIYSGAISSSKSNQPFLFVTKNGSKRKIPLYEPQKVLETALAYDFEKNVLIISYNLLLDHTGDSNLAESGYLPFSARFYEIFIQDSWFFLSNRIETFLREREQTNLIFTTISK
ncbi:LIC14007 family protein [Leptospira borgpetersenii]|uniref:Uncharacterized protein n=1 Tax=Leptospira borgpetersenii serovar Pomona str. 200901868 TaxID=1192866 RepID=M6W5Q2_LEPBO|nr:hypothetical protein [Leptospira borgpetersenii]EMO65062.1 hypothetical protein LEP1GSC133_3689 [Leptospira borgpetersenii serovar Pomona str. 200901868]MBE8363365.1 hypothetical protein [Leptospira borgpetersenii serovar Balcanica]MBE8368256.1 hypothetical protein [Leptospira borgpetersenii serovar Balcanica]MBE8400110.1 hypothetical protein [Leptospira borgpetersenii serovar Tarassovi]MBE8404790.1 hypothetical protein [Leptospira borgpetersenii serovar Tarassovi]